jgi:hypothetical protein
MPASNTSGVSAAAYGEADEALDSWEDVTITTEYDGDGTVTIDAAPSALAEADEIEYPFGKPGVGIRLSRQQAVDLATALLEQADPEARKLAGLHLPGCTFLQTGTCTCGANLPTDPRWATSAWTDG